MPIYIKPSYQILTNIDAEEILCSIERAGRTCYKSEDRITENSAVKFVQNLIKRKHFAMLEHQSLSVLFVVDRGVSHEIVRHRICSFAQESTRFCDYGNKGIILIHPPGLTEAQYKRREEYFWLTQSLYDLERAEGIPPELARGVLPTCLKTEIVVSANLREWRHIFDLRAIGTTGKPHPQMLEVMVPLLKELNALLPVVFDDIWSDCTT
jgi:thymidylate synthase (FAD)